MPGVAETLVLVLSDAIADVRALIREVVLVRAAMFGDVHALADALIRTHMCADTLADVLALARGHARAVTRSDIRDLTSAVTDARSRVNQLTRCLDRVEIDVCGIDLYDLSLRDVSALDGVVWSEETVWPPSLRHQVRERSREIHHRVYQVAG